MIKVKCFKCRNWVCIDKISVKNNLCYLCPVQKDPGKQVGSLEPLAPFDRPEDEIRP